jgi:asparagine synthase (glutamine-hydrolysing)
MCGIAGIVRLDGREVVEEARLKRMRDVLRHRGPDGEGLWIDGAVGLGHRRLSIVDVAGGHQPMAGPSGTTWIVYNGEVYNHATLRQALEARGHRYRTRSDTETVLHLYDAHGERFVEHLDGMFAFALWDGARRRLGLVRDRLGIKPLYYRLDDEELLFASEIKAILAVMRDRPRLDAGVLPEFLATGYVAGEQTFFAGIRALEPGCALWWTPGEPVQPARYWRAPSAPAPPARAPAHELRERLEHAVHSHLMSDVPLGLFLSGGLDSSALAGLMSRAVREPIRTFSVGFTEREADERPYARLVARAAGAEHREVVVSSADVLDALPRLVWHEDAPLAFPASVPLYFVSTLAAAHVKVVLTGEGADELFLGYNRYRVTAWNARLGGAWTAAVPAAARAGVRRAVGALPGRAGRYAARTFLARDAGIRDLYCENFAVFPEAARRRLLRAPAEGDPFARTLALYAAASGDVAARLAYADVQTYLVALLMKQDRMSMAASVESRVPYLDHRVAETALAMPAGERLRGFRAKAVLRDAVADVVPPAIMARRKLGFPVPLGAWLRGPWRPVIDDLVLGPRPAARGLFERDALAQLAAEHQAGVADHGLRLWLLVNLELWQRTFIDGEEPAVPRGYR